jgi:hypothetical protein
MTSKTDIKSRKKALAANNGDYYTILLSQRVNSVWPDHRAIAKSEVRKGVESSAGDTSSNL